MTKKEKARKKVEATLSWYHDTLSETMRDILYHIIDAIPDEPSQIEKDLKEAKLQCELQILEGKLAANKEIFEKRYGNKEKSDWGRVYEIAKELKELSEVRPCPSDLWEGEIWVTKYGDAHDTPPYYKPTCEKMGCRRIKVREVR